MENAQSVLIVEDDFLVGEKLRGMLEDEGYRVVGDTANGKQAVALTLALQPDVVVMDLKLLEMDGLDAARQIAAQCPTPIVALTAHESPDLVAEASEAGVGYYLVKPATGREIARAIQIAVARFDDLMRVRRLNAALQEENAQRRRAEAALRDALAEGQRRENETRWLLAASQAVMTCHTFPEAARRIFDVACEATGAVSGYVAMMSDDGAENELLFLEAGGLPCDVDPDLPMPIRGLRAEAYAKVEVVYDNDFASSPWQRFIPPNHVEMRNVMFAPIVLAGRAVGVVGLANKPADFTEDDARMAKAFGDMAAIALRRVQAEDALRASETRFRTLFEAMTEGVSLHELVYDEAGAPVDYVTVEVNPAYEKQTGLAPQAVVGRRVSEAYGTGEPPYLDTYASVAQGGGAEAFEVYFPPLAKHFRVSAFSPAEGQFATVFEDVTERKAAAAQLQQYAEHLEAMVEEKVRELERARAKAIQMDKMAALGQLATGVAHELNQPLTAISFDADYLKLQAGALEGGALAQELEEVGGGILGSVDRCRRIVDHLRTFGRVAEDASVPVNLNDAISDCFILAGARLRHHNVDVRLDLAEDLPAIPANPHKLEQVFLNLISNAEHALEKKGAAEKVLTIRTWREGSQVLAQVRDNGCGMPEAVQAHLFEPFFTTKPEGQGTGLGLAISRDIVEEFGGQIACESAEGRGSTFTLRFPIAESPVQD